MKSGKIIKTHIFLLSKQKKIFLTVNASWTLFLKKKECRSVKIKILETLHQVKINHKKVTEILKEGEEIKKMNCTHCIRMLQKTKKKILKSNKNSPKTKFLNAINYYKSKINLKNFTLKT